MLILYTVLILIVTENPQTSRLISQLNKSIQVKPEIDWRNVRAILLISAIVILTAVFLFFIYPKLTSQNSASIQYSISLTHNGHAVDILNNLAGQVVYQAGFYDRSSMCGNSTHQSPIEQSPTYSFSNLDFQKSNISLKDAQGNDFAYDLSAFFSPLTNGIAWNAYMVAPDSTDSTKNYDELPKTSQSFSADFEIPFFNVTSLDSRYDNGNLKIHADLADQWNQWGSSGYVYCLFTRDYNPEYDLHLPECSHNIADLGSSGECADRAYASCGQEKVRVISKAVISGDSIDCSFALQNPQSGESYQSSIKWYEPTQFNGNTLYKVLLVSTNQIRIP